MVECEIVTLEGIDYAVVDSVDMSGINYLYLSNINEAEDCCIRKVVKSGEDEMLEPLNGDEEFDKALMAFKNKYE